jgi:hypothetical protein
MSAQLDTLKRYQAWRRGDDSEMLHPFVIGQAIDYAIAVCCAAEIMVEVNGKEVNSRHHSAQAYGRLAAAVIETSTKEEQQ